MAVCEKQSFPELIKFDREILHSFCKREMTKNIDFEINFSPLFILLCGI